MYKTLVPPETVKLISANLTSVGSDSVSLSWSRQRLVVSDLSQVMFDELKVGSVINPTKQSAIITYSIYKSKNNEAFAHNTAEKYVDESLTSTSDTISMNVTLLERGAWYRFKIVASNIKGGNSIDSNILAVTIPTT